MNRPRTNRQCLLFLCFIGTVLFCINGNAEVANTNNASWLDKWSLTLTGGYGVRTNPLINSDDLTTLINIDIAWFGEKWYFSNGDIGRTLTADNNYTLELVGQLNNERAFFSKTNTDYITVGGGLSTGEGSVSDPTSNPDEDNGSSEEVRSIDVPDRDYAYEAGFSFTADMFGGQAELSALSDISGAHNGYRVNAAYSKGVILRRWFVQPALGISFKSSRLVDYYFGVREDEVSVAFDRYKGRSTVNYFVNFRINYALSKRWFWGAVVEYESLGKGIADSTLIEEDHVLTAFTGVKYQF